MKVRIVSLPKASSGKQVNKNLPQNTWYTDQISDKGDISVKKTLAPVSRAHANVEAEKGEVAIADMNFDGIPEHFVVGGNRHFNGGTPLNLPADSFIFSDTQKMKIKDPTILARFGASGSSYTPADLAKKYDLNKYRATLYDKDADKIEIDTAEKMIQNYNLKLGELALVQESKKGFPQGIPTIAFPYLESSGLDPQQFLPAQLEMQQAKFGGQLQRAQRGGEPERKFGEDNRGNFNFFQAGEDVYDKASTWFNSDTEDKDGEWKDISDFTEKNGVRYKNYGNSNKSEPSGKPLPDSKGNLYIDPETNEYVDGKLVEGREYLFGEGDRGNLDYLNNLWDVPRNMVNYNLTGNYEGIGSTLNPNNPGSAAVMNYMTNPLNLMPITNVASLSGKGAALLGNVAYQTGKFLVKGVPRVLKVVTKPAIAFGKWAVKNPTAATNLLGPVLGAGISGTIAHFSEDEKSPLPNNQKGQVLKDSILHIAPPSTPVDTLSIQKKTVTPTTKEPGKRKIIINGKVKYF